jgi:cytochrome c biogenesis protein CcdA
VDYAFSLFAGLLSILSPCVLPLLPIVFMGAGRESRLGPLALLTGLVLSFTAISLSFAFFGLSIGLGQSAVRKMAAGVLIVSGIFLISGSLQQYLTILLERLLSGVREFVGRFQAKGVAGQGFLGVLLGVLWAPCTGPALGAATGLAMQAQTLPAAAGMMALFAVGASIPLILIAYAGERMMQRRKALSGFGRFAKPILGALLVGVGVLILTGFERTVDAYLTSIMPEWLIDLSTRY